MKVIFCDNDIIVCHKERGELSECADESAKDSLPRQLGDYLAENGQKNTHVFAVHRLDRETEGVMVYARNSRAAAALSKSICDSHLCYSRKQKQNIAYIFVFLLCQNFL